MLGFIITKSMHPNTSSQNATLVKTAALKSGTGFGNHILILRIRFKNRIVILPIWLNHRGETPPWFNEQTKGTVLLVCLWRIQTKRTVPLVCSLCGLLEIRYATALTTGAKHWHRQKAVFYVFCFSAPQYLSTESICPLTQTVFHSIKK